MFGRINASSIENDLDDKAGLRGNVQFYKYTHTPINIIDPLGGSMRGVSND